METKTLLLFFLFFVLVNLSGGLTNSLLPGSYKLALQWPNAVCTGNDRRLRSCDKLNATTWPYYQDFKIHGLWQGRKTDYHDLREFKEEMVKQWDILNTLKQHWPDLFKIDDFSFWSYEWREHGYDTGITAYKYFESVLWIRDMPLNSGILGSLQQYGLKPGSPTEILNRVTVYNQIKAALGYEPELICNKNYRYRDSTIWQLKEIRICIYIDHQRNTNPVDCRRHPNCGELIRFPDSSTLPSDDWDEWSELQNETSEVSAPTEAPPPVTGDKWWSLHNETTELSAAPEAPPPVTG